MMFNYSDVGGRRGTIMGVTQSYSSLAKSRSLPADPKPDDPDPHDPELFLRESSEVSASAGDRPRT